MTVIFASSSLVPNSLQYPASCDVEEGHRYHRKLQTTPFREKMPALNYLGPASLALLSPFVDQGIGRATKSKDMQVCGQNGCILRDMAAVASSEVEIEVEGFWHHGQYSLALGDHNPQQNAAVAHNMVGTVLDHTRAIAFC